jgi:DnaD/phage-associated family protein
MAKFRMVHTEFWSDPKVMEEFTPEDKLFFSYLLTNSKTTQIGIYQITQKQMAVEIGFQPESIKALMDRFINHHKIIKYNYETREIAIKNWGKYNFNRGGKPVIDCVKSELADVKDKTLIKYVGERVKRDEIKKIYESYHDTYHDSSQESRQEKEEEKEEEKEKEEQQEQESRSRQNPFTFYEENFGPLAPFIVEDIGYWIDDLNEELVVKALEIALVNQKPWNYAKSILRAWLSKNVKSVNDVNALEAQFKREQQQKKYGKPIKEDITPDWYEKSKAEREQALQTPAEDQQKKAEEADRMLQEYLASNA